MKINKYDVIKKYGKSRCLDVQYYLDRLSRGYGFPYSEMTLYEMVVDFENYTEEDFSASYKKLDEMEFYGPVKRSHIKKACSEAKADRIRAKQLQEVPPTPGGCPMPDHIAKHLTKLYGQKFGGTNGQ